jgi:hypothetical protein
MLPMINSIPRTRPLRTIVAISASKHWFDFTSDLVDLGLIQPVFWISDNKHDEEAKFKYGDEIVQDLASLRFKPFSINLDVILNADCEFFNSENYKRAKELCIKMMDRIDEFGLFNRLDREAWFHRVSLWLVFQVNERNPDLLLISESAHNFVHYLLFEICSFFNIRILSFNIWLPVPLLFAVDKINNNLITLDFPYNENIKLMFKKDIDDYIDNISNAQIKEYEAPHISIQRIVSSKFFYRLGQEYSFIRNRIGILKRKYLNNHYYYDATNPINFSVYKLRSIRNTRKKSLQKSLDASYKNFDFENKKYVYYPLHYEPERTTTPDGGIYHDQIYTLIVLRAMLPSDVHILVKEHPSQFLTVRMGFTGRSPLIYHVINQLNGVLLVDINTNSLSLIKSSICVATITGTVALEAAVLGIRALVFGSPWFQGCPNTFQYKKGLTFADIEKEEIFDKEIIKEYLHTFMEKYCIPGFQNPSNINRFKKYITNSFYDEQKKGLVYIFNKYMHSSTKG